jgi:O-antigen/teichoic acid export membrane protein
MSATIGIEDLPANPSGASGLDLHQSRQHSLKIKRNAISGICRFAILTIVYFLTYPYMLHHLGVDRFGMWALALVVSQSLGTQDLGISGALMRFIPEHWNNGGSLRIRELASTAIFLLVAIGVLLATGLIVMRGELVDLLKIPPTLQNEMSFLLVGMACAFFLNLVSSGLTAILIGIHRMYISNITYTAAAMVQAVGVFLVLSRGYGLLGLTLNAVLTGLLWALSTWILLRRCMPGFRLQASLIRRADAVSLLRYGSNIQAAGLGSFLTVPPIKILLSRYVSLASVSSFELASGMAMQLRSGFLMAAMPLIPASAHLNAEKASTKLGFLYRQSFRYVVLVALPVFSVAAILAPGFTQFWLRKGASFVAPTLALLLIGWFLNTLTLPAYFMFQGQGFARYQVYVASLQAIGSAISAYILVKIFGYYGAVSGLVIGLSIAAFYLLWQYPRLCSDGRGKLFDKSILKAIVANTILLLPFILRPQLREIHHLSVLTLISAIYLVLYVLLLFAFEGVSQIEGQDVASIWPRKFLRSRRKRQEMPFPPVLKRNATFGATKPGDEE